MAIGAIAGLIGAAGGAASLFANQGGGGGGPSFYQPRYSGSADQLWQIINSQKMYPVASKVPGQVDPIYLQALQQMQGLPFGNYQSAATQASQMYPGLANADTQTAGLLAQLAQTQNQRGGKVYGAGQQLWNTAQDPQNALYNRTAQQVQDQTRAGESARGIAMTPYGAGLESQAMSNFNIDWQNQQLQRQAQGLQGYMGANTSALQSNQLAGQDLQSMLQYLGQAPQNIMYGGSLPITAGADISNLLSGGANAYTQGVGSSLSPLAGVQGNIIPYLYAGQGAGANAFNAFNVNRNFDANQQMMGTQGLIQGLNAFGNSGAGKWFGNLIGQGTGSSGGSGPTTADWMGAIP